MQLKYINKKSRKSMQQLYNASFPENERVSFSYLLKKARHQKTYFYQVLDQGNKVGLVYLIEYKDIVFIFYLAIDPVYQGQGLGSKVLGLLKRKYQDYRIILNIEAGNDDLQIKRKAFYLHNDFHLANYQTIENHVCYLMLYTHGYVSQQEYFSMVIDYFGKEIFEQYYISGGDEFE